MSLNFQTVPLVESGLGKISILSDPNKAVKDADVIFSDKVISMNDKVDKKNKL